MKTHKLLYQHITVGPIKLYNYSRELTTGVISVASDSASDVADVTAVYVEQAERDSNQAAVRHLACLLAVLKRELEALKVSKRSMRRERHVLLKEVAALRRQIATEADAVRRAEEELRQEKAYTASLERECDSLREKVRDCGEKPSGPKKARKSDIIEPER